MCTLLVCIEGIDGSGKETQASLLAQRLYGEYSVQLYHFPNYLTESGELIRKVLYNEVEYPMQAFQVLYALNRYQHQSTIEHYLNGGTVVICDRYIPSSIAYGLAQGQDRDYLEALDKINIPPDLVIYIDVDPRTAINHMKDKNKDMNEQLEFLEKVTAGYEIQAMQDNWRIVDGERPVKEVADDIYAIVKEFLEEDK